MQYLHYINHINHVNHINHINSSTLQAQIPTFRGRFKKKIKDSIDFLKAIPKGLLESYAAPKIKTPDTPITPPPPTKMPKGWGDKSPKKVLIIRYLGGEIEVYCPAKKIKEDGTLVHIEFYNRILELKNVLETEEF